MLTSLKIATHTVSNKCSQTQKNAVEITMELKKRNKKTKKKKTYSQHTTNKNKTKKKHQYSDNNLGHIHCIMQKQSIYLLVCVKRMAELNMSEWETFGRKKKARHVIDNALYSRWKFSFQCLSIWIVHWIRSCQVYLYELAFLHLYLCFCFCYCTNLSSANILVCQIMYMTVT